MSQQSATAFHKEVRNALLQFRGALTELVTSVGADPKRPQEIARNFKINRNLSWKLSKIIEADHPYEVVPHIPGATGIDLVLGAFEAADAPRRVIASVRRAMQSFQTAVETHAGDRATFDLMLDSMTPAPGDGTGLQRCRKLAFQGNSGLWGIQGRVRLASYFVAPSAADDGMLDIAVLGGFVDVRRLRPDVSVPLFMRHRYNDDGTPIECALRPIVSANTPTDDDLLLLPEFCSDDLPRLTPVPVNAGTRYELTSGPVGNTAAMTWIFGWHTPRFASMYRTAVNTVGEHPTRIYIPTETLLCDLFVHERLPFRTPQVDVLGQLDASWRYPDAGRERDRLPFGERVVDITAQPPAVATTLIPRYTEMVSRVFDCLGHDAGVFRGSRFIMKYPPMPSVAVLRYDLPQRD
jgi:hypothetical protein